MEWVRSCSDILGDARANRDGTYCLGDRWVEVFRSGIHGIRRMVQSDWGVEGACLTFGNLSGWPILADHSVHG